MASPRVAVMSVHTSPMDQPGSGDSGGMNVYIRAVTERLASGVEVDLFTRCRGGDTHDVREIAPGIRVVSVKAGPCNPVPKSVLPRFLPEFLGGVLRIAREDGRGYDIVHSHYWLSGWVGRAAKEAWRAPLVASFHTLGKVKNYSLARGEPPEPPARLAGEERVIADADRILAPTPSEAAQLVGLYRADPDHIRLVPPGVDHTIFVPRDRAAARERAAPVRPAARAVRRPAAGAQGARRRRADPRRGGGARSGGGGRPGARDRGRPERRRTTAPSSRGSWSSPARSG